MNRLKHMRFSNDLPCFMLPDVRAPLLETLVILNGWITQEHHTDLGRPGEPYTFPSLKNLSLVNVGCEYRMAMWYFACMTRNASQIAITQIETADGILHSIGNLPEKEGFWPNLRTLICDINIEYSEDLAALLSIARCWDRYQRGLTLKMPRAEAKQWRELAPSQATYEMVSALCTIEELATNDPGPWPPSKEDTLDRRFDFGDSDYFPGTLPLA